jgi:hypothetical protein
MLRGLSSTKKKEPIAEGNGHKCPNPLCGKVFTNPLKAENLGSKNVGTYYACPYCLTEITLEKGSADVEEKEDLKVKEIKTKKSTRPSVEKEPTQSRPTVQGCSQYFGYLSKRSSKEKIPEECITCEKIVQCMLKGVTG